MGQIKGLHVILVLTLAIIAVNGQLSATAESVHGIHKPSRAASGTLKPAAAPKPSSAPHSTVSIAEAETRPINAASTTNPTRKPSAPQVAPAPVEESPGYLVVFAEDPVPAPAPAPVPAPAPFDPTQVQAPIPNEPVVVSEAPTVLEAIYRFPPPSPNTGIPPAPAPGAFLIPSAAVPPAAGVPTPNTGPIVQPARTGSSNITGEQFVVAPGLDLVLRDGGGADPWPIPDWSWAGYAGGNYQPAMPTKQFNVMDYGALHDDVIDCAPAIQAAIDAASAAGGGTVYLPAGKYLIKNQVIISTSNILLKGAGKTLTTLYSPYPLSMVIQDGRNSINSAGQSRFSWADGFVKISGQTLFSSNVTLLGKVISQKSRGWTALNVDTPQKFTAGMWVRLYMTDVASLPTSQSLASMLYDNQVEKSACGEKCLKGLRGTKDIIRWAVQVKAIDGNKIIFQRPLPMDVDPRWLAELHAIPEAQMPQDSGIEDIGIEFALKQMKPHLKEAGFNGIAIEHSRNCWVKNVEVINSDSAIIVRYSHHVTIDGIDIYANGDRTVTPKYKTQGHIGIGLYESSDVEVKNFNLRSKMLHDTTVRGTILCVFHNGRGIDLNLDSHRGAPYGTLYSSIDLGAATRVFTSGGSGGNGFPAAAYTTYWNLRAGSDGGNVIQIPSKTALGECTYGAKLAFQGKFVGKSCKTYYMSKKQTPNPTDLFASQVYKRLSGVQS